MEAVKVSGISDNFSMLKSESSFSKGIRDKCAVFGIKSSKPVFFDIYHALYSMQHRGQESAGMAFYNNISQEGGNIKVHNGMGLVCDVFDMSKFKVGKSDNSLTIYFGSCTGIGHVRYSTAGETKLKNAQPIFVNYAKGTFAIAHNGNISNYPELRESLERKGAIFTGTSDTEVIAHLIARKHIRTDDFIEAITKTMNVLEGSYSLVILRDNMILGVRDPYGFRPLVFGMRKYDEKVEYAIASESCALDAIGMDLIRDVKPSEILVINSNFSIDSYHGLHKRHAHCMFEYVYFSRPDSIINNKSVYGARKEMGRILYRENPVDANIVIPVPDSGITSAVGYSEESDIPYSEGLMKNRYVWRTFIMPKQQSRKEFVRIKFNPIKSEVKGNDIVLIDDSLVRGTTMRSLVYLLKKAGAEKIHVRISSPPIKFPCLYGIDMQTAEEFIACEKTVEQIRQIIGADSLKYITLEGLVEAIGLSKDKLCLGCLTGEYPVHKHIQERL